MGTVTDLRHAASWVDEAANQGLKIEWLGPYEQLRAAAFEVGRAWCGSWLPRFSALYDRDLAVLPLQLRVQTATLRDSIPLALEARCRRWTVPQIRHAIQARAGHPDETTLLQGTCTARAMLNDAIVAAVAALECESAVRPTDHRLTDYLRLARHIDAPDAAAFVQRCRPLVGLQLKDAMNAEPPPHIAEMARLEALHGPFEALRQVAGLMRMAALHLQALASGSLPAAQQRSWLWPPDDDATGAVLVVQARRLPQTRADPFRSGLTTDETTGER